MRTGDRADWMLALDGVSGEFVVDGGLDREEVQRRLDLLVVQHGGWLGRGGNPMAAGRLTLYPDHHHSFLMGAPLGDRQNHLLHVPLVRLGQSRDYGLTGVSLAGADLRRTNLVYLAVEESDMSGVDLERAIMVGMAFRGVDLRGANLLNADVEGVHLAGVRLDGAVMPDGRTYEQWRVDPLDGLCDDEEAVARASAAWGMHTWQSCPMRMANGWSSRRDAPASKWERLLTFLMLFDAGMLPQP